MSKWAGMAGWRRCGVRVRGMTVTSPTAQQLRRWSPVEKPGGGPRENPHWKAFCQLEKNLEAQREFVSNTAARVAWHQKEIEKCKKLEALPLKLPDDIVRQQNVRIHREFLEESLRVIVEGIEKDAVEGRVTQFWQTIQRLPPEAKRNEDQLLNTYCQFLQPADTIPEISIRKVCSACKSPLWNNRRESQCECKNPLCARAETYLTLRSSVRIAYRASGREKASAESFAWKKGIDQLRQYVQGNTPLTPAVKNTMIQQIQQFNLALPLDAETPMELKASDVNKAWKLMDRKELTAWTARTVADFNQKTTLCSMSSLEFETLSLRLKFVRHTVDVHGAKHKLQLCSFPFAFYRLCELHQWPHLFVLFPLSEEEKTDAEQCARWKRIVDFMTTHDHSTIWQLAKTS